MKTIEEVRRIRLDQLKEEFGSFAAINVKLERLPRDSTLSQIANKSMGSKTKKPKVMGSDQARMLEEKLNKPRGWMDTDPELLPGYVPPSTLQTASAPTPISRGQDSVSVLVLKLVDRLAGRDEGLRRTAAEALAGAIREPSTAPQVASLLDFMINSHGGPTANTASGHT